jgi:Fic family protein
MKQPGQAPTFKELLSAHESPAAFYTMMDRVGRHGGAGADGTYRGRYAHWDDLKHLPLPEGIDARQLWAWLKFRRRSAAREIPLRDRLGQPFLYGMPDSVQEALLFLDQNASGRIQAPEQIVNSDTRDRYLVNSLIEEAIRSSQLEGAATTRRVAKEMIRSGRAPMNRSEQMILNNFRTMQHIVAVKDRALTPEMVLDIQRKVTENTLEDPDDAGRVRTSDDVRVFDGESGEVLHTPPPSAELAGRMRLMCDFANGAAPKGFLHPILRAVLLHFWLAYDHPFVDGNGRTARALFYWSALRQGYWLFEFISISQILRNAPAQYARSFLLSEADENDLTYFILYHLDVIRRSVDELHAYLRRKAEELTHLERQSKKLLALNHRQKALIVHALRHPDAVYTFESHRQSHGVVRETARRDLLELARKGYLKSWKAGKVMQFGPADRLARMLPS